MRKNTLILSLPFHSLFLFSTPTPFSYVLYLSLLPFLPLQLFISLLSLLPNTPIFILIHFPSLSFTSFPFLQILSQSPFFLSLSHVLSPLLILLSPVSFFLFPSFSSFPHSSSFSPLFLFLPLPARRHPPCHPTEGTDYPISVQVRAHPVNISVILLIRRSLEFGEIMSQDLRTLS